MGEAYQGCLADDFLSMMFTTLFYYAVFSVIKPLWLYSFHHYASFLKNDNNPGITCSHPSKSPKSPSELLKLMQLWSLALVILFIATWIPNFLLDDRIIP